MVAVQSIGRREDREINVSFSSFAFMAVVTVVRQERLDDARIMFLNRQRLLIDFSSCQQSLVEQHGAKDQAQPSLRAEPAARASIARRCLHDVNPLIEESKAASIAGHADSFHAGHPPGGYRLPIRVIRASINSLRGKYANRAVCELLTAPVNLYRFNPETGGRIAKQDAGASLKNRQDKAARLFGRKRFNCITIMPWMGQRSNLHSWAASVRRKAAV